MIEGRWGGLVRIIGRGLLCHIRGRYVGSSIKGRRGGHSFRSEIGNLGENDI